MRLERLGMKNGVMIISHDPEELNSCYDSMKYNSHKIASWSFWFPLDHLHFRMAFPSFFTFLEGVCTLPLVSFHWTLNYFLQELVIGFSETVGRIIMGIASTWMNETKKWKLKKKVTLTYFLIWHIKWKSKSDRRQSDRLMFDMMSYTTRSRNHSNVKKTLNNYTR